jgi:hypothetical protein
MYLSAITDAVNKSVHWTMRRYRWAFGTITTPLDGEIAKFPEQQVGN